MTFLRLRLADWLAMAAALALLFAMAADWYSTKQGHEARRIEGISEPSGALGGEVEREVQKRAREAAEGEETNAWQADGAVDRLILMVLIATALLALAAGFLRAAGRRFMPPLSPSGLAAMGAALGALLVVYRMLQEPGLDDATTVESGAPLALIALAAIAYAGAVAMRAEEAGAQFRELPQAREEPAA